jgi:hypothetical protein
MACLCCAGRQQTQPTVGSGDDLVQRTAGIAGTLAQFAQDRGGSFFGGAGQCLPAPQHAAMGHAVKKRLARSGHQFLAPLWDDSL